MWAIPLYFIILFFPLPAIFRQKFWKFGKKRYLCTAKSDKVPWPSG